MMVDLIHTPVMLQEALEGLAIAPDGVYVDATFGCGGHALAILDRLKNGHLYAFDHDHEAAKHASEVSSLQFSFVPHSFRHLSKALAKRQVYKVDGVLADLGMSTAQLHHPKRGFSHRLEGPLDMRMDASSTRVTAAVILNTAHEKRLSTVFSLYGELPKARRMAAHICRERTKKELHMVTDLTTTLKPFAPPRHDARFWAQVFQALRIAVNDEMSALREFLRQTAALLHPAGRLVVLSYHSLEDRLVKRFLRQGDFEDTPQKDAYGHAQRPFESLHKKPVMASLAEVARNKSARSAKLRVGLRVKDSRYETPRGPSDTSGQETDET